MERLTLFQIGIPGSAESITDALYANGNHQCKLMISILKQTSVDGAAWQAAPLSDGEKSSLTVLPYAKELRPQQAKGWYCDAEANQYAQMLWRRESSPETTATTTATEAETAPAAEQFYRYMRFNSREANKQPAQFMASVTLDDGTQYSTRMDTANVAFDSSVTINPQSCHAVRVQDLTLNRQSAFDPNYVNVVIYYWALPDGLRIVKETFRNAGYTSAKLEYAYALHHVRPETGNGVFLMGMAIRLDVTRLTLGEIDSGVFIRNIEVPLINSDSMLRAAWYMAAAWCTSSRSKYDKSLLWTITDSYGCESSFILRANPATQGLTLQLLDPPTVITTLAVFQISFPGTTANITDALYANGNQQCRVLITILKQTSTDDGRSWQTTPLSDDEKASLTVLPYSIVFRPPQARGWYCDDEPNRYQEGLWPGSAPVEQVGAADIQASVANTAAEEFYRYMRFNSQQAPIEPARFMASITLDDGTRYSTHMDNPDGVFESSIVISPQKPYLLRVSALMLDVQRAYTGAADVDAYYWTLPNGLTVMEEMFSGEGQLSAELVYAYAIRQSQWFRMGMAIRRGVTYLTLGQIDPDISPEYREQGFPLIDNDSMLRAGRYRCWPANTTNTSNYDNSLLWIITDNYGCQSNFILRANPADQGDTLQLLDIHEEMTTLAVFQIGFPGTSANTTDALYANGNQQRRVLIKILQQTSYDGGASWQKTPLSDSERASLTVLPYSDNLRPSQAQGWYSDDEPNEYQEGLWRSGASIEGASAADTEAPVADSEEEIYRYMRFDGDQAPIEPTRFMASITLDDGTRYSTHMDNADGVFESSIVIRPQEPYFLRVGDLTQNVQRAYTVPGDIANVDAYYWTLPNGLRLVKESFSGQGYSSANLEYAYAKKGGQWFRMGMAIRRGVTDLTLGQIDPDISPEYREQGFSLMNNDSMLRAARYQCWIKYTTNDSDYDNSLYWNITDNYGCVSSFILRANPSDGGDTLQLFNNETLAEFQIGLVASGASVTDALYANGNQQCKVFIRIVKKRSDGRNMRPLALSSSEKANITVLPYSNALRPSQAPGWYCDSVPNEYDEGLWRGTGSVGLTGSPETKAAGTNLPTEVIYRYMRFNGNEARIHPTRFMACITLDDGTQYSTHMQKEGEPAIESSIVITPQTPYSLRVNDLTHERQDAFTNTDVDVDTYYWTLPGGLRIVNESFINGYPGGKVEWAYGIVDGTSWYRMGIAIKLGVTTLTLGEIDSRIKNQQTKNQVVPLIDSDCMMRGAKYACRQSATDERWAYDALMYWTITDNYGCQSTFVLKANNSDKGNRMELLNG
jgi:hypothetical protein